MSLLTCMVYLHIQYIISILFSYMCMYVWMHVNVTHLHDSVKVDINWYSFLWKQQKFWWNQYISINYYCIYIYGFVICQYFFFNFHFYLFLFVLYLTFNLGRETTKKVIKCVFMEIQSASHNTYNIMEKCLPW